MKQFTSRIDLTLLSSSAPLLAASAASQKTVTLYADPFTFLPTPTDTDAGLSWLCDHTFVIDTPSDSILAAFRRPRHTILTLHATDGSTYDIGTITMPATAFITRHLQRSQLVLSSTMLFDPLA